MSRSDNSSPAPTSATPLLHAIDLERALTEDDYATNSEALQECLRAWKAIREAGPS